MDALRLEFGRQRAPVKAMETSVVGSANFPNKKIDAAKIQRASGPSEFFHKIKSLLSERYVEVMAAASTNIGAVIFVARTGALIAKAINSWRDQKGTSSSRILVQRDDSEEANRQSTNISSSNRGNAGDSREKFEEISQYVQPQSTTQNEIIEKSAEKTQECGNLGRNNVGPVEAEQRSDESYFPPENAGTAGERSKLTYQNAQLPEVQKQSTGQGATRMQDDRGSEGNNVSLREETEQLDRPSSQLENAGNSGGKPEESSQDEQRHVAQSPSSGRNTQQIPELQNAVVEEECMVFNGISDDEMANFLAPKNEENNPESKSLQVNPPIKSSRSASKLTKA